MSCHLTDLQKKLYTYFLSYNKLSTVSGNFSNFLHDMRMVIFCTLAIWTPPGHQGYFSGIPPENTFFTIDKI